MSSSNSSLEGKFRRLPCKSSFFLGSEGEITCLMEFLNAGKKRTGIFLMISLGYKGIYIRVVLKQVVLDFLGIIIAGCVQHVQNGVNSQHHFIFKQYFRTLVILLAFFMKLYLVVIDIFQKLKLISQKLQEDENSIGI